MGASVAQATPPEKDSVYYASPDGRDQGECQQQHPCSLEQVQGVVRHEAAKGKGDVTVVLADGTYRIDHPLEFRAQDSGQDGHTVRWTAAPGAHPEISGSTQLTGWQQYDEAENIYVADTPAGLDTRQLYVNGVDAPRASTSVALSDLTLTPTGMTINNPALAYLADLPKQNRIEFESLGDFTDRYSPVQSIAGNTITMAQPAWNNNTWGWDTAQYSLLAEPHWYLENSLGFLDQAGEWYVDPDAGKLYYKPADGVNPQDLDIELPRVQALISVGGTYDAPVSHLEFSGLTFTGTSWLGPSSPDGYASQQNGGYLKGTVDYRPADAFASCSRGCEQYERTRNTWFQEPSAVQVSAADHITFAGNTFRNLGSSGLGIGNDDNATLTGVGLGASNIDVTGNVFTQVGGHALFVGGIRADAHHPSDPRMTNQDILIENNTISHVAVEYKDNSGILSTYVTRAQIVHNEVENLAYAIDTGYGWGINDAGGSQRVRQPRVLQVQPALPDADDAQGQPGRGQPRARHQGLLRRLGQHLQPLGEPGDGDREQLPVQRLRRRHLSGRGQPLHALPAQRPEWPEHVGVHQRVRRGQRHERQHAAGELVQLRRGPDRRTPRSATTG